MMLRTIFNYVKNPIFPNYDLSEWRLPNLCLSEFHVHAGTKHENESGENPSRLISKGKCSQIFRQTLVHVAEVTEN